MLFVIGALTLCSTLAGGFVALRLRDRLHLIAGFAAGAVVSVALFELLRESIAHAQGAWNPGWMPAFTLAGFAIYLMLDRLMVLHAEHHQEHDHAHEHHGAIRGAFGAGSLSLHSMMDGLIVGLAWRAAPAVGFAVALAILAHDFSDGINTVSIVLRHGGTRARALRWLAVDACMPLVGITLGSAIPLPEQYICVLMALFAGFFLYIGASDLLPESHHAHPTFLTTVATLLGMSVIVILAVLGDHL